MWWGKIRILGFGEVLRGTVWQVRVGFGDVRYGLARGLRQGVAWFGVFR